MNKADSPILEAFLEQQASLGVVVRRLSARYTPIRVGALSITEDRNHFERFEISGRGPKTDADQFVIHLLDNDERLFLRNDKAQTWDRYRYCKDKTSDDSGYGWNCAGWMISWQELGDSWHLSMWKQPLVRAAA